MKKRKAFFSEPMIKYLWKLFILCKPEVTIHHLRRTRSHPFDGEERYKTLLQDMIDHENLFNIQILPDQARNDSDISLLTLEETEQDLKDTGKFNKRNAELLR